MGKEAEDRRHVIRDPPPQAEAVGVDRRQFPPPADAAALTAEARELQWAIDSYKMARRLKRVTVAELLDILGRLGYRRQ